MLRIAVHISNSTNILNDMSVCCECFQNKIANNQFLIHQLQYMIQSVLPLNSTLSSDSCIKGTFSSSSLNGSMWILFLADDSFFFSFSGSLWQLCTFPFVRFHLLWTFSLPQEIVGFLQLWWTKCHLPLTGCIETEDVLLVEFFLVIQYESLHAIDLIATTGELAVVDKEANKDSVTYFCRKSSSEKYTCRNKQSQCI